MRLSKIILSVAVATLAIGFFAAPKAHADDADSYFFNRRKSATESYSLVGPHATMDATNAAIEWSLQNGYEVEWEADGSAPKILLEQSQPTYMKTATKIVVVPKIIYVRPAYSWHYWKHYRYHWKNYKLRYQYNPYYHWKLHKKFKWSKGHKHFKVKKFKAKKFKHRIKKNKKKLFKKVRNNRRSRR